MTAAPAGRPPAIAAIDIGTNSVLLTIATMEPGNGFRVGEQHATVTRLGQDVDRTRVLHPDAKTRTLACLSRYRELMNSGDVIEARAVGTSALRDAAGGEDFLARAREVLGFEVEVVSGAREAELTFFGALSGLEVPGERDAGSTFVFDIGGGSTELIVGAELIAGAPRLAPANDAGRRDGAPLTVEQATSLDMGSVRLTERHKPSNPPTATELESIRAEVREALNASGIVVPNGARVVGVAGTVTTLYAILHEMAEYDPDLVHGQVLAPGEVSQLARRLGSLTLEERLATVGLSKGRADVIVAGSILCDEILKFAGASELVVSDRGVRFGLLMEIERALAAV